jgi:hypothetical protein
MLSSPALIKTYCVSCHNSAAKTGGLALDTLDPLNPGPHADVWEEAIR